MRCDIMVDLGGYIYPEAGEEETEPQEFDISDIIIGGLILFIIAYGSAQATGFKSF